MKFDLKKEYEKEHEKISKHDENIASRIRVIGESLIKNAESLAGSEDYISEITFHVNIVMDGITPNEISVVKKFYSTDGETMGVLLNGHDLKRSK